VIGADLEDFGLERFGLRQPPVMVELQRLRQRVWTLKDGAFGNGCGISAIVRRRDVDKVCLSRPEAKLRRRRPGLCAAAEGSRARKCDQLLPLASAIGLNFSATPFMQ
jgi:hypothetical protein